MAKQLGSNYYNSPYKFNGKELDEETGLYYYGARYYSPRESIWLSVDPLAENGPEYSPYCYTFNNPVNMIDPDGEWPTPNLVNNGKLKSSFGVRVHPITGVKTIHKGADISAKVGSNVRVAADGVVTKIAYQFNKKKGTGWGHYIEVTHKDGYISRYAHLKSKEDVKVEVGQPVENGEYLGLSGQSGGVTGPHLHFEILKDGKAVNPMEVFDLQTKLDLPIDGGTLSEIVIKRPPKSISTENSNNISNTQINTNSNKNNSNNEKECVD
jgi:RHS repeat-associated protein